jgi:hypothetical protein
MLSIIHVVFSQPEQDGTTKPTSSRKPVVDFQSLDQPVVGGKQPAAAGNVVDNRSTGLQLVDSGPVVRAVDRVIEWREIEGLVCQRVLSGK